MIKKEALHLQTPRLDLRPFSPTDTPLVVRILQNPRVVFWRNKPISLKLIREKMRKSQMLNKKGLGWWLIFEKETGALVGDVLLQPLRNTFDIEIGYHILPDKWGKGYATEAAGGILHYGFQTLKLARINAVVLPRNHRSLRVIDKLGMVQRGTQLHEGLEHRYFILNRNAYEDHTPS